MGPSPASNGNADSSNVAGVNSQRICTVSERLAMYAKLNTPESAPIFINLCISLSRGIDYAIANNEIPAKVSNLPKICKLVCRRVEDYDLQAAIMVLMVTMKHACEAQWFSTQETQEVLSLSKEVSKVFNTRDAVSYEQTSIATVSEVMSRYYPQLKLGHVLACIDIKPGFEAHAVDFHITKQISSRTEKRIQMLVTKRDNIETSSCIITPQKANFLLNGRGVIGRMVGHMEVGPQLPTVVTSMLRYGTNLLQAIGHFDAHYIVLIAFMGDVASSSLPVPEDYVQPASVTAESDVELEEGPWRISLKCPISLTRIKRPAKGKGCKHLECFDLSKFLDMTSRCPSWKCPSCSQSLCYPDLRIDKRMFNILQEIAENVSSVIINTDGSWEVIYGDDDHKDGPITKLTEKSDQPVSSALLNVPYDVYDLTEGDDDMVIIDVGMPEDSKPIVNSDLLNTSTYMSNITHSATGNPIEMNQNSAPQFQGITHCDSSTQTNLQPAGISTAPRLGHFTQSPVLTDSVSSAARQTQDAIVGTNQQPIHQTLLPSPTNHMQLQHTPCQQSPSSVYGGNPLSRNAGRPGTPLPGSSPMMSTGPDMNNVSRNTSSLSSHRDSLQQHHIYNPQLEILSAAQRAHMPFSPIIVNSLRPTSGPQAANQSRPTTPAQVSNSPIWSSTIPQVPIQPRSTSSPGLTNTFRPALSPQAANQPRPTTPVQVSKNPVRPTLSPQLPDQPRSTTPSPVPSNTLRPPPNPQVSKQPHPATTPLQISNHTPQPSNQTRPVRESLPSTHTAASNTLRPTSNPQVSKQPHPAATPIQISNHTPQPSNQTRPTRESLPSTLSAPPHLRGRSQTQPGRGAINPQYRLMTASVSTAPQHPSPVSGLRQQPPIQMQYSRRNPSLVPSSSPPGQPVQVVSSMQDLVGAHSEQNWQSDGRMRGSLTGRNFSESLSQFVIRPTQQTAPNPPAQLPNQVIGNRNVHASSQANPSQNNNS